MHSGFETYVAWRYLLAKKRTGFISIISVISIVGIALGVAALIIVLSLMNGFTKEIRTRLLGMDGHIWVTAPLEPKNDFGDLMQKLKNVKGVTGATPFCTFETVAHDAGRKNLSTVFARGIDLSTISDVSDIKNYLTEGGLDLSKDENGVPGMVLGRYVALTLKVTLGETVYLFGGNNGVSDFLDSMTLPPLYKFRVTGIFDSGYFDYDNSVVFIDLPVAQKILGLKNEVSGIALKLDDAFKAYQYTKEGGILEHELKDTMYYSENWIERNKSLFSWMKLEKWAAFIVLSLIVLVAAFNIISTLIMMVMDKTKEIGILKSMGATNKSIERIFVYQGIFVGFTGTISGSIIGYTISYIQDKYRVLSLPSDIYFVSAVPMDLQMRDFLSVTLVALLLCLISSYYPAKKASSLDPVDAIRSE